MNTITTTDVDMWMSENDLDHINDNLDDCFCAIDSLDPDDPYMQVEPLGTASTPAMGDSFHVCDDRRSSMVIDEFDSSSKAMDQDTNNEFQDCFEQFNSDYVSVSSHGIPPRYPEDQSRENLNFGAGSSPEDFDRSFRRSLTNLEQSMRRSEESRRMLGEHRSAISMLYNSICASDNGADHVAKGRSQLFSYMTTFGNSTL